MKILAVIDATDIDGAAGPATQVAGLSLVERTARLAAVCGAQEIVICAPPDDEPTRAAVNTEAIDAAVHFFSPDHSVRPQERPQALLLLDAGAVYDRSMVNRAVDRLDCAEPGEILRSADGRLAVCRCDTSTNLEQILKAPKDHRHRGTPHLSEGWIIGVDSEDAVRRASRRLWNGCRKPQDGIVSRHLNRHISITISRLLAPTWVKPNHVTTITLTLGVVAAVAAGIGGYFGFLAAGIVYQLNSIIDGVDGELARVRYEFSVVGEWLDTISDDMSDLLLYIGLGIGAWRTMADGLGPFGPEVWLWLGLAAALGKVASMVVYYRWLIAHGRGDLLAFEWSFEDDSDETPLSRALSMARYLFRKDFIVFAAMILSFGGFLPHLLIALAPGNLIVAASVVSQQLLGSGGLDD